LYSHKTILSQPPATFEADMQPAFASIGREISWLLDASMGQ
jgi:hypothetical protein